MSTIGQSERITQNRVVKLFQNLLDYTGSEAQRNEKLL